MSKINCNNFKNLSNIIKNIKDDIVEIKKTLNKDLKNIKIDTNLNLNGTIIPKKNKNII